MADDVQAVLFDLDGVLYVGGQMIAGADVAVRAVRERGLAVAGLTNTTTQPRRAIAEKLARFGIDIGVHEIFTPAALAQQVIGRRRARLLVREALLEDFQSVTRDANHPEVVVMGDLGDSGYAPSLLNEIFRQVMDGAELLALHKNRFWQKSAQQGSALHLDLGPFVAAIEYATGQSAQLLGKPSRDCFHGVCQALQVSPAAAWMVGDDVESDVGGAQAAGLRAALVQTGKYRAAFVRSTGIVPDLLLPSVAELPAAL